ncbi:MAG: hypothetical protein AABY33_09185 [Pseudomonadota bacterium]
MSINDKFVQFAPSRDNEYYPGVFGWGLETNGFRIVMYGPAEYDHPVVKNHIVRGEKFAGDTGGIKIPEGASLHRKYTSERRQKRCMRAGEHGPCHVHVFDIKSGRETRFELVEHYKGGEHFSRPLHLAEKRKNSLTDGQMRAVEPVLNSLVPDFIQCWREMYQNEKLSGYVSRAQSIGSNNMVETMQPDGAFKVYDPKSGAAALVHSSLEILPLSTRYLRGSNSGGNER